MTIRQVSTFYLDNSIYGIDVDSVLEVGKSRDLTPVPLAGKEIRGLMNLRGRIVTVIDLAQRLKIDTAPQDQRRMSVIVSSGGNVSSLLVDKVGDVLDLDEKLYEKAPDSLGEAVKGKVKGVYKLEDKFLHMLDVEKIVNICRPKKREN